MITYNSLISNRNLADSAFSTIDIMLKKRSDLIPNLVEAVKGYMTHEATLLERIAQLRSVALQSPSLSSERMSAEGQLSEALGQFRVSVENYPDLKASDQFLRLQGSLNECEEQISAARRAFNAAILRYNNSVDMFPTNLLANALGFQRRAYFQADEADRANPRLNMS
jgi:LemA protein